MTVKYGIRIKINVSMIMKAWLFSGKKGKYLDATVFLTPNEESQFGDHGIINQDVPQSVSQQDPTVTKGPLLGNCKVFWSEGVSAPPPQQQNYQAPAPAPAPQPQSAPANNFDDFDDGIPF